MKSNKQTNSPVLLGALLHFLGLMFLLVFISPIQAAAQQTQDQTSGWSIKRHEWSGAIPAGIALRLVNHFGDFRLRHGDTGKMLLVGAIQQPADSSLKVDLSVQQNSDGLLLQVRFLEADGQPTSKTRQELGKRRVDVALYIPGFRDITVETINGMVEAKGLTGTTTIKTESGKLRVLPKGPVYLYSQNGPIHLIYKKPEHFSAPQVESLSGNIRIELPPGIKTTARLATSGLLTCDFSTQVTKRPESPHKEAVVQVGGGGPEMLVTSAVGNIMLLEAPAMKSSLKNQTNKKSETSPQEGQP